MMKLSTCCFNYVAKICKCTKLHKSSEGTPLPVIKKNNVSYVFLQLPKNEIRNANNADDRLEMTSPSRPIRARGHSKMPPRSYLLITLSLCKIEYQKIFNFVINKLGDNILRQKIPIFNNLTTLNILLIALRTKFLQ